MNLLIILIGVIIGILLFKVFICLLGFFLVITVCVIFGLGTIKLISLLLRL